VKEATQKVAKSKKRPLNVDESERSTKRPYIYTSRSRIATNLDDLINLLNTIVVQLAGDTLSTIDPTQPSNRMRNARKRLILLPLRSGRNTRLPTRFL
jgi:hypothetical protein